MKIDRWFNQRKAAEFLGISTSTVFERIRDGNFPTPVWNTGIKKWSESQRRRWQAKQGRVKGVRRKTDSAPCLAEPGSKERIETLRRRCSAGLMLWHPDDLKWHREISKLWKDFA